LIEDRHWNLKIAALLDLGDPSIVGSFPTKLAGKLKTNLVLKGPASDYGGQ
jgi:hypothetical protein